MMRSFFLSFFLFFCIPFHWQVFASKMVRRTRTHGLQGCESGSEVNTRHNSISKSEKVTHKMLVFKSMRTTESSEGGGFYENASVGQKVSSSD